VPKPKLVPGQSVQEVDSIPVNRVKEGCNYGEAIDVEMLKKDQVQDRIDGSARTPTQEVVYPSFMMFRGKRIRVG